LFAREKSSQLNTLAGNARGVAVRRTHPEQALEASNYAAKV